MEKNIKVPVKNEDLTDLKIGDVITLTGNIITARDQAHKRILEQGAPLDIEINPNEMTGDSGLKRMESLIQTYMDLGGNILTITGTSREKLIAAQKEPEKYQNLRVRLGGFSAYFISLSKEVQNSIIGRTSHEL